MSVDTNGPVEAFAERLRDASRDVPSVEDRAGLDRVRSIRRRRRRSHVTVGVAAASCVGLVAVGLGIASSDDSTDDLIVTATPPTPTVIETLPATIPTVASTTVPDATTTSRPDDRGDDAAAGEQVAQRVSAPAAIETFDIVPTDVSAGIPDLSFESPPGVPADFGIELTWEFLVEWNGGFLLGRSVQVPPDGVELEPLEANALLGDELLQVLFSDEPATAETAAGVLRAAGFGDRVDELLDDHPDLFEAIYSFEWPFGLEAYYSADATSWEPFDIELPAELGRPAHVASTGDRLAVLSTPWRNALPLAEPPVVWSSTDLIEWTSQIVPVEDPFAGVSAEAGQYISRYVQVDRFVAGQTGWGIEMTHHFNIDVRDLIEQRTGHSISGYGLRIVGGQLLVSVDEFGQPSEEFVIELADLGLTPEHAALLERNDLLEVWVGGWNDDAWSRLVDFSLYYYGGIEAFDNGLAVWTATALGVVDPAIGSTRSFRIPDDRYSISTVVGLDDVLVVHANDPNGFAQTYELDEQASTWSPVEIDRLPPQMSAGPGPTGSVLELTSRSFPPSIGTRSTFETGDLRYTAITDPPTDGYEVRRISTNEVIVAESVDTREVGFTPDQLFEFRTTTRGNTNITVIDPESGDPLIEMDAEDLRTLWESRTQLDGTPVPDWTLEDFGPRDTWLMVPYTDGWLLRDLDDPPVDENGTTRRPYQPVAARSGDLVLIETVDGWELYDLA